MYTILSSENSNPKLEQEKHFYKVDHNKKRKQQKNKKQKLVKVKRSSQADLLEKSVHQHTKGPRQTIILLLSGLLNLNLNFFRNAGTSVLIAIIHFRHIKSFRQSIEPAFAPRLFLTIPKKTILTLHSTILNPGVI